MELLLLRYVHVWTSATSCLWHTPGKLTGRIVACLFTGLRSSSNVKTLPMPLSVYCIAGHTSSATWCGHWSIAGTPTRLIVAHCTFPQTKISTHCESPWSLSHPQKGMRCIQLFESFPDKRRMGCYLEDVINISRTAACYLYHG